MENQQSSDITATDKSNYSSARTDVSVAVLILIAFIFSMIGSSYFATPTDATSKILWSHKGGLSEPFIVEKDNSLARIEIFRLHQFRSTSWDVLKLEVLDDKKRPLGGVAIEFWLERGADGEGYYYSDSKIDARLEYFFNYKGQYYFRLSTESNALNLQQYKHLYQMVIYPDIDANIHFRTLSMFLFFAFIVAACWAARHLDG